LVRGWGIEGGREDIERRGGDLAKDDASGLVGQPKDGPAFEDLGSASVGGDGREGRSIEEYLLDAA
jgi:hypothetical protein